MGKITLDALRNMPPKEFAKAKPYHLKDRNETEEYQQRGIQFTDMMFEDGGRPRYVIETVMGITAEWITIHEINHMLGINKTYKPREGVTQVQHDRELMERLRDYIVKYPVFCKYIKKYDSKWNF